MNSLTRGLSRIAALVAALAIMAIPVVLVAALVGNPIPADLIDRLTARSIDDDTIIKLLSIGFYICWAWFCTPALRQLFGQREQQRPRIQRPRAAAPTPAGTAQPSPASSNQIANAPAAGSLDGPRGALARLVRFALAGGAVVTIIAGSSTAGASSPTSIHDQSASRIVTAVIDDATPAAPTADSVPTVTADARDTPYSIAHKLFPDRVDAARDEIVQLNRGRPLPNGSAYQSGTFPTGWEVVVPDGSAAQTEPAAAPAATAVDTEATPTREVVSGDSYWTIADDELTEHSDGEPSNQEVADYTEALIAHNAPTLGYTDPNMLHPGDVVETPDPPEAVPAVATTVVAPTGEASYQVITDDSYWTIAETQLRSSGGVEPTGQAVYQYTEALIAHNAPILGYTDPKMLQPGDTIALIAPATPAPTAPSEVTTAPEPTPAPTPAERAPEPQPAPELATPEPAATEVDTAAPQVDAPPAEPATADPSDTQTSPVLSPTIAHSDAAAEEEPTATPEASSTASPTADPLPAPARVDASTGPAAIGDTTSESLPLTNIVGATTIAAAVIAALELTRRRRRRPRKDPRPDPADIRTELALRGLAAQSRTKLAEATVAAISAAYRCGDLPTSALVQRIDIFDDDTIDVVLDEPVEPHSPFAGTNTVWTTTADHLDTAPDPDAEDLDPLLATVVSLGRRDDAEVFVDLESLGAVTVTGDAEDWLRGLRSQLTGDVAVYTNDDVDLPIGTHHQPIPADIVDRLDTDRAPLWEALQRGDLDSSIHARLDDYPPYEQRIPACILDAAGTADANLLARARAGSGVVCITTTPGAPTTWDIHPDGHVDLHPTPPRGVDYFGDDNAEPVVANTSVLTTTVTSAALLDEPSVERIDELLNAPDPEPLSIVSEPIRPTPAPIATPFTPLPWKYMVRVLRPEPDVVNQDNELVDFVTGGNRNGRRSPELLAFLHQSADHTGRAEDVREALWYDEMNFDDPASKGAASKETVSSLYYRTRTPLGKQDAIATTPAGWKLNADTVTTDIAVIRHSYEHVQRNPHDWHLLHEAIGLIAGEPFRSSRSYAWATAYGYLIQIHEQITNAVALDVAIALVDDRLDDAIWSCDRALTANPINEAVHHLVYDVEGARGNHDNIRNRHAALVTRLRDGLGEEPDHTTTDRYNKWIRRSA